MVSSMKKSFIRMNDNDNYLSLGNLFRIIKEISKSRISAVQSQLFCILFDINDINDTTINNYCVGCRSIGNDYKQIFLNKEKKYKTNHEVFCDNIIGLINIIDGTVHIIDKDKISFINNSASANLICKNLYHISKNDSNIENSFSNHIHQLINENKIYEALVEELIYIVLYNRQPLYEETLKREVLNNILNDTSISSISLEEYLSLKLREGINYDFSLKKLAQKGNAYANFEIGSNEYYGYYKGYPRYLEAFKYLNEAAKLNHASANYMIGNMLLKKLLGNGSKKELESAYEYLKKAYELGNIAACNSIGYMYLEGIYPLKKDLVKAQEYFNWSANHDYAYSYNNLGRIEENNNHIDKAFEYYLKSANLGESWACNKVGEYYRESNMELAFKYYNDALDSNIRTTCFYAYYNLAKYFYLNGYLTITSKDINKAIEYFKIASEHNILEALEELFYIYVDKYLVTHQNIDYIELIKYKEKIESHPIYDKNIRDRIEKKLKLIKDKQIKINIDCLTE